ncbi:MAG: hypothetical protein PHT00_05370, partial [Candidatus Methanomethylophilus sp.]|nr:hypothetical protein [Methanomethylophilus sp.]
MGTQERINMDTITKNTRKTLLATVLVAMLALVAVAGVVTYADDSDASSSDTSYLQGNVDVSDSMSGTNIFIYNTLTSGTAA